MKTVSRFELKYRISPQLYYQVKNALMPYVIPDNYTLRSVDQYYLVRSLYFDTFDYRSYKEKDNGDYGRIKLRIRTYETNPTDSSKLSVEIKARFGNSMEKHSTFVSYKEYEAFMENWHWLDNTNPILTEFERLVLLKAYRPKVLIEYRREGFYSRDGQPLRITFDHGVRSACTDTLFPPNVFFKPHPGSEYILEVKSQMKQPSWLHHIIREYGLKLVSNSKYAQGIETARPDIIAGAGLWDRTTTSERAIYRLQPIERSMG